MNKKEGMEWIMEEEWSIWIFVILLNPFSVNLRIFWLCPNGPAASFSQARASPPPEKLSRTQTLTLHHRLSRKNQDWSFPSLLNPGGVWGVTDNKPIKMPSSIPVNSCAGVRQPLCCWINLQESRGCWHCGISRIPKSIQVRSDRCFMN